MTNMKVIHLFLVFSGLIKSSQPSPEPQGLFQPSNHQILATIDAVFGTLRISDNFTKSKNVAHYLSLNNFVKETVKKNDKIYQNIYRKFKSASSYKTGPFILSIDKVIGEMMRRQKVKIIKDLLNNNVSNSRDTSQNRLVIEFIKFAKGFNLKLNTPSPYDLLGLRPGPEQKGRDADARRIYNGTATRVTRYPFMASLHVRGRFVCPGSLIRADLLITAVSGLIPFISPQSDPRSIQVRVGSDYTNKFGELVSVAGFHFHPKFNRTTLRCNLAIIQLKTLLELEDGKLNAIQYDMTADYLPADVKRIIILGWGEKRPSPEPGRSAETFDASNHTLSLTRLDLQDLKECKQKYSRTYVSNKHFCAGSENHGGGACQFDVGGPAVAGRTLVGVASFGASRCGERDAPTVFTKLGFYADWIESFFKEDPPHTQHNPTKAPSVNITDSDEVPAVEKRYYGNTIAPVNYKPVRTAFKLARDRVPQDVLYGLENEDDTFKKTSIPDPRTHPLLDQAVFLDPDLIPTMPKFSEELTETTRILELTTLKPAPLNIDKEMENMDWDLAEGYLLEAMGYKKPTSKAPTSTNTIKKLTFVPLGLATIPQYTKFSLTTTTESAYGEYSIDFKPHRTTRTTSTTSTTSNESTEGTASTAITASSESTATTAITASSESNDNTAGNASAADTKPAVVPFTRMGPSFRSQKQYRNSQHKFPNAQKDKKNMNHTFRGFGSIP